MIQRIRFENLKGRTGDYTLAPLTIITGGNFTGKTAIVDAVKLALLGRHPAMPDTNAGAFALSSGEALSVQATVDGQVIGHTWKQSGSRIQHASKGECPLTIPSLDGNAFIGAKNAKERLAILAAAAGKATPAEKLLAVLNAAAPKRSASDDVFADAESIAASFEEIARGHKATVKQWEKTIAGLADLINAAGIPAKPESKAAPILEAAIRAHSLAMARLRAAEEKSEAASDAADELGDAGPAFDAEEHARLIARDAELRAQLTAANAEVERIKRAMPAAVADVPTEAMIMEVERDAARLAAELAELTAPTPEERMMGSKDALRAAGSKIGAIRGTIDTAERQINELQSHASCPYCKAESPGWQATVKATLEAGRDAAFAALAKEEHAQQAANDALAKVEAYDLAAKMAQGARIGADLLSEKWKKALAHAEAQSALTAARQAVDSLQDTASNTARHLEERTAAQKAAGKAEKLNAIIAAGPHPDDVTALAAAVIQYEDDVTFARAAVGHEAAAGEAYKEAMQREKDMVEARANLKLAEENADKATASAKAIRAAMHEDMKTLFGPIMLTAGKLSEAVLEKALTISATGEIGAQGPVSFIPFQLLSGTEQVVATAAVMAGLSAAAGGIVILDELSRLDAIHKPLLFAALQDMVAHKKLGQVILIDHDENTARRQDGWTTIKPE